MTLQEVKILPGVETIQQIFTAEMFAQQIYINGQHILRKQLFKKKMHLHWQCGSLNYIYRANNVQTYINNTCEIGLLV